MCIYIFTYIYIAMLIYIRAPIFPFLPNGGKKQQNLMGHSLEISSPAEILPFADCITNIMRSGINRISWVEACMYLDFLDYIKRLLSCSSLQSLVFNHSISIIRWTINTWQEFVNNALEQEATKLQSWSQTLPAPV